MADTENKAGEALNGMTLIELIALHSKQTDEALQETIEMFRDADLAFVDRCMEKGVPPLIAFAELVSIHESAFRNLKEKFVEMLKKATSTEVPGAK